ncbi:protein DETOXIFICATION 46, chloroplastic [Sesamum alatum]|uniref:Protein DETOXIFICATION n=1 Tax=Sesamum alatum TaxID=300844 RepID=A0AAE2CWZ3_9LAMI|nr:protein DETOXIFICATION 46, chloroplastic [Sesamum alatum]
MILKTPLHHPSFRTPNREFRRGCCVYRPTLRTLKLKSNPIFISNCISPSDEVTGSVAQISAIEEEKEENIAVVGKTHLFEEISEHNREEFSENESLWSQMVEIAKFSGPAVGLWICGPLMSLIDTAVIGQGSSIELAALGPGTVFCDNTSYVFMFLSIATSNFVATSLARQDKNEVQHQISILLFIGLACGFLMLFFTRCYGPWALTAFAGANNAEIITAANTYVQIRGLAWPAILIGWVAQSASLGMKDSWGPLKALAVASAINGIGDIVLCRYLGYGIAGAAWATMASQVVAAYMMIEALNSKGYNGFAISVPSPDELLQIFLLAAPVFVTMMSKVAFYSLLVYFATSMGTKTIAAHQVMIQVYCMCTVWGEPLSQTAQSFMPELIYGANRNLAKARTMLKSLVIIGAVTGLILGFIGTTVPWLFPKIFSPDPEVIQEMHKVLIPYFLALCITPSTHSLEGTLLAGRDLKFISTSMTGIFCLGSLLLLLLRQQWLWFKLAVGLHSLHSNG